MIKVLHIISDTNIGGAGRLLVNYLKNFDKNQFLIKVIIPKKSLLKSEIKKVGYETIEIEGNADKSLDFKVIGELIKIFKQEKPDIVHTHSSMSGKIAAYMTGVKTRIYTRHCAFEPEKMLITFPGKQINGFINNTLTTRIIAVAQIAKDNLTDTGVDGSKIDVIINGVEPLKRLSYDEKNEFRLQNHIGIDDFVIGIIARLEDIKGQKYFIDSIKILSDKYPHLKGLIMGTGSEEQKFRQQVKELDLLGKVIFTGFIDDITPYVNIMDLNINCSYGTETSSLALSEAMSVGKPAVASVYGGNPYMVTEGENGLLVPIKDAKSLANAIEKIMTDKELYNTMSEKALDHYKNKFTANVMTKQLEKIYMEEYKKNSLKESAN